MVMLRSTLPFVGTHYLSFECSHDSERFGHLELLQIYLRALHLLWLHSLKWSPILCVPDLIPDTKTHLVNNFLEYRVASVNGNPNF